MGLSKDISSPEELYKLFAAYKEAAKANPIKVKDWVGKDADEVQREKERPLTMESFENFVADNGGPIELSSYFANREQRYLDFVPICLRIRREIRSDQIEGGMAGIYNPSITQRLNGLVEKTEIKADIQSGTNLDNLSQSELKELASMLDKLNEH